MLHGVAGARGSTAVRVVAAPIVASSVTLQLPDGRTIHPPADGLPSRTETVPSGAQLLVRRDGSTSAVAKVKIRTGVGQTIVISSSQNGISAFSVPDPKTGGNAAARVRFVNAIPGPLEFRFSLPHGPPESATSTAYGEVSQFIDIPNAMLARCRLTSSFDVKKADSPFTVARPRIAVPKSSNTTVFVFGYDPTAFYPLTTSQSSSPSVQVEPSNHAPSNTPVVSLRTLAGVQIFDAIYGSGRLRITVDGEPRHDSVVYGSSTFHIPLSIGEHHVGAWSDKRLLAKTTIDVRSTTAATTLVLTKPAAGKPRFLRVDELPSPPTTQASVQFVHAQWEVGNLDISLQGASTTLLTDLRPGLASQPVELGTGITEQCFGNVYLTIRRSGSALAIKQSVVTLDPGASYLAIAIRPQGSDSDNVKLVLLSRNR